MCSVVAFTLLVVHVLANVRWARLLGRRDLRLFRAGRHPGVYVLEQPRCGFICILALHVGYGLQ